MHANFITAWGAASPMPSMPIVPHGNESINCGVEVLLNATQASAFISAAKKAGLFIDADNDNYSDLYYVYVPGDDLHPTMQVHIAYSDENNIVFDYATAKWLQGYGPWVE